MKRVASLDGLRGLAAMAVVLCYTSPRKTFASNVGGLGVEVFFVLSGFLIGGILMDTVGSPGWAAHFYWRRTLRIWPLFFLVIALGTLVDPPASGRSWMTWAFAENWRHLLRQDTTASTLTWSIDIEEAAYLLLPWVVLWTPRRLLPIPLLAIAGMSVALRAFAPSVFGFWSHYFSTFHRLDGICLGACAAWILRERPHWIRPSVAIVSLALWVAHFVILTHSDPWASRHDPWGHPLGQLRATLATATLIPALVMGQLPRVSRVLSWRPLVWVGTVSYGLYLWHELINLPIKARMEPGVLQFVIVLSLSLIVAAISWYLFEKPLLRLAASQSAQPPAVETPIVGIAS